MMLFGGGYSVYTTMDFEVQNILDDYFLNTSNFSDKINDGLNYAMVVTDSTSGDLVGIVGRVGEKSGNRLLSHASVSHIPGSVLKPLALYAPLIDRGVINYATVFDDVPLSFSETDGEIREYPKNSPMVYDGLVTVSEALTRSKNTVAMRLSSILGNKNIFNFLKDEIGFSTLVESEVTSEGKRLTDIASSPMALGQLTHGIPLTALTEAYSVFPSYGNKMKMRSYLYVDDYKGERVLTNEPRKTRIFKESTAKIMNMMLKNVVTDGTAKSITLKEFFDVAGKTGTSGGNKDKLFIGYTPYYTAGVWCGFETGGMSLLGISPTATEVFDRVMTEIHERVVDPSEDIRSFSTDGLLYLPYCKDSGEIYTEICKLDPRGSRIEYGYFSPDNIPTGECKTHIAVAYDSNSKGIALKGCPDENIVLISLIRVENRSFPKEIYVTDAEFVYRDIGAYTPVPRDDGLPYFYYEIPNGEYVGITDRKKQFNSGCKLH